MYSVRTQHVESTNFVTNGKTSWSDTAVTKLKKYKTPKVQLYIVIVLSCPLTGSLSSSVANRRAAQNNCYIYSQTLGI